MQITIINDCRDQNAKLRQVSRAGSLFKNASVNCFGVGFGSSLEASGFLVDAIDSFEGKKGIIILNVAPRSGQAKKWKNGTPFGFFWRKKTLVLSSVEGFALSLSKKLGVIKEFYILDIAEIMSSTESDFLNKEKKERIINSQFRSFDFLPLAAKWIFEGKKIPYQKYNLSEVADVPRAVWFVDNFGNIKTTLTEDDLPKTKVNETLNIKINNRLKKMIYYKNLRNVPDKKTGLVAGSSGFEVKRFVEIVSQGESAAEKSNIKIGDKIKIV